MKNLLLICLLIVLGITVSAQKYINFYNADTIYADTNVYGPCKTIEAEGLIVFKFTKTDVTDSLSFARIEGSYDNSTWTALTGTAVLTNTTTNGTTTLYVVSPLMYLYYRGRLACAAADAVAITAPMLLHKRYYD